MARALGREEEQPVQALVRHGLEHGEDGAQRLADARGRLRHQALAALLRARHAVDGHGQLALARAKALHGKAQRGQRRLARRAVGGLAARPVQEQRALLLEEGAQRGRVFLLHQHGFLRVAHVEIHQGHAQPLQAARLAQQMGVDARLGPVQGAVVGAHALDLAPVGLDFLELAGLGVEAVGAAAHAQVAVLTGQADLGLVVLAPARLHQAVAGHALQRAGRGREAQVQVARARRELAQRAHGHGVAHAASPSGWPRHWTWHTRTGMPCSAQYCSQRIWLSCSLSPGALASTSS